MGFRFIKIIAILLLYTSIVSSGENDLSNNLAVMPFKSISVKEGDTEIINNCVRSAFVNTGNFLVVAQ